MRYLWKVFQFEPLITSQMCSTYGGVQQRWLVVQSESRKQADLKQLDKRIAKAQTKKARALKDLCPHPFACETDALDAAKLFAKKLKYHCLTDIKVQLKPHYERPGHLLRNLLNVGLKSYLILIEIVIEDLG